MRKIIIISVLMIIIFIGNFSLWFLHTRSINQALLQFRKELLHNNIKLNYEDITFTNFKSWHVKGTVKKVSISYGKDFATTIKLDSVGFQSYPFEKNIKLISQDLIKIITLDSKRNISNFNLIPIDGVQPRLQIDFDVSLKNVADALNNVEKPKLHLIDSLNYFDNGFEITDDESGMNFASIGPLHLDIKTALNKLKRKLDFNLNFKNLIFNQNYISSNDTNSLYIHYKRLGSVSMEVEFTYSETPSRILMELMNKDKENKKNYKNIFDSYQIEVKRIAQITDIYSMNINGYLDRQPNTFIPEMDLNIQINNYKGFSNYISGLYNSMLNKILIEQPGFPAKPMTELSTLKLIKLFEEMKTTTNDDLNFSIKHKKGGDISVADRPIIYFLNALQNIFIDEKSSK